MGRTGERAAVRAVARWAGHPGTLVAVLVLLFNDRAGKRIWPGTLVAGKLSDLAWMLVAPVVVAFLLTPLLRLRGDRPALVGLGVTAVTFTVAKSGPAGGELASRIWSASGVPSRIEGDPTDLVALPLLAVSWWLWTRARAAHRPWQWLAVAGVPLAVAAMVATSAVENWSSQLWKKDGVPVLDTPTDRWTTADGGTTWTPAARARHPVAEAGRDRPGSEAGCVPDDPRRCFRLLDSASPIEASEDGGRTWHEAFDPGPSRRRLVPPPNRPEHITTPPWPPEPSPSPTVDRSPNPAELLLVATPDGWAVLAHYPGRGLVRGDQDGTWALQPYPVRPPVTASPPPDGPRHWPLGLPVAVVAGCAAVFAATGTWRVATAARHDRARLAVALLLRQVVCLLWLLLAVWLCGGELLWTVPGVLPGAVLTLALLPILALVWRGPRPAARTALALGVLGAVSGAAVLVPYLLWGTGSIRTWSHASDLAVVWALAGTAAGALLGAAVSAAPRAAARARARRHT
ncbi:hypothetical protein ACFVHB_28820 [Kitasatospora sp. NPDC127111]|uniref:hypothetical protein n=1 Tax=Kitasatospora sp. NPDC127111 TaxID=3345363 RepID=UPI003637305F